MNNEPYITSSRQKRAVEALLEKPISVKGLGPKIGALNPSQVISELRNQGFKGMILTRRFQVTDRDGKCCLPGEYYIPQELKPEIEMVLKKHNTQARTRRSDVITGFNSSDSNREV